MKTMKKDLLGPVVAIIFLLAIAGLFTYFFIQLNRMDKKMDALQAAVLTDANKTQEVVNFFNSALNAQNAQK